MTSIGNLMAMINARKTLIIANGACGLNKLNGLNNSIFIYTLSGSVLQKHDVLEKEKIRQFIDIKKCTQVIFVGSIERIVIERILEGASQDSLGAGLRFNASVLLRDKADMILSTTARDQMLTELLVVQQCFSLMDYYFIREAIEARKLVVRGVVSETPEEPFKSVFYNGVVYNDLISMN